MYVRCYGQVEQTLSEAKDALGAALKGNAPESSSAAPSAAAPSSAEVSSDAAGESGEGASMGPNGESQGLFFSRKKYVIHVKWLALTRFSSSHP